MDVLPPRVREQLASMPEGDRKMRAQEIKGNYERNLLTVEKVAEKMVLKYTTGQSSHYRRCIAALDSIIGA